MLVINFKGIIPQNNFYSFSVKGNNKSNKVKFLLADVQDDLDLSVLMPYLKAENKEHNFVDKIPLTSTKKGDLVELVWLVERKNTQFKNLSLQLQFQSNDSEDVVWQSMMFQMELCDTIKADEEISEKYPTELEHLEKEVAGKQDKLISGENIKTINGESILGGGDLPIDIDKSSLVPIITDGLTNLTDIPQNPFAYENYLIFWKAGVRGSRKYYAIEKGGYIYTLVQGQDLQETTITALLLGTLTTYADTDSFASNNASANSKLSFLYEKCGSRYFFVSGLGIVRITLSSSGFYDVECFNKDYYKTAGTRNGDMTLQSLLNASPQNKYAIGEVSDVVEGNTIPVRDDTGQIKVPLTPTENDHAGSKKYIDDLIKSVKKNSYIAVDITEFPTLADFLASTGEEGYLYLYPIDTTDLSKGYHTYIYEVDENNNTAQWIYMGDTSLDLTNYYNKTEVDTKLAEKQNVIDSSHKLESDLIDDTNQTNKFVSQAEKDKINATTLAGQGITDAYTKDEVNALVGALTKNLSINCYAPVGDSTDLTGISVQVKDATNHIIASGTYNGTTLVFTLPLNQTYKIEVLTQSTTIGGITYFAPELESGSDEGTLSADIIVDYRYSSTQYITSLNAIKQFLALQDIDIATKRLALVRTETNSFSVNITITNPANGTEYTMPLYVLDVEEKTKLVNGVEQTFTGARIGFAYALPDNVPFDQREQVQCDDGETFQSGIYYYTATSSGIGDKAFTPLTEGTDYQVGDSVDTYESTNNVYVFKHAWSNTQYGSGNKSTSKLMQYGCNIYHKSNIHKWLNASGDNWFTPDHLGDTISGSWFDGKKGFKDWFKASDLAIIEDNVAYGVYEIDGATLVNNKIYTQFILLSGTEIAGSVNSNEGSVFDYWKYLNGGVISNNANSNRTACKITNITSKQTFWLRSPNRGDSYLAWCVYYGGVVNVGYACGTCAILPSFTI